MTIFAYPVVISAVVINPRLSIPVVPAADMQIYCPRLHRYTAAGRSFSGRISTSFLAITGLL